MCDVCIFVIIMESKNQRELSGTYLEYISLEHGWMDKKNKNKYFHCQHVNSTCLNACYDQVGNALLSNLVGLSCLNDHH